MCKIETAVIDRRYNTGRGQSLPWALRRDASAMAGEAPALPAAPSL